MSEQDSEDPLSPAELRVRSLLGGLRAEPAHRGARLPARVTRTARWQRSVRRALLSFATAAEAMAGGLRSLLGRSRR